MTDLCPNSSECWNSIIIIDLIKLKNSLSFVLVLTFYLFSNEIIFLNLVIFPEFYPLVSISRKPGWTKSLIECRRPWRSCCAGCWAPRACWWRSRAPCSGPSVRASSRPSWRSISLFSDSPSRRLASHFWVIIRLVMSSLIKIGERG